MQLFNDGPSLWFKQHVYLLLTPGTHEEGETVFLNLYCYLVSHCCNCNAAAAAVAVLDKCPFEKGRLQCGQIHLQLVLRLEWLLNEFQLTPEIQTPLPLFLWDFEILLIQLFQVFLLLCYDLIISLYLLPMWSNKCYISCLCSISHIWRNHFKCFFFLPDLISPTHSIQVQCFTLHSGVRNDWALLWG